MMGKIIPFRLPPDRITPWTQYCMGISNICEHTRTGLITQDEAKRRLKILSETFGFEAPRRIEYIGNSELLLTYRDEKRVIPLVPGDGANEIH